MVRETERQTDDPVVVDLVLPADPAAAEAEAERVMAALADSWCGGGRWCSSPASRAAGWSGVVADRIDLGRRLARPSPAPAAVPCAA